MTKADYFNRPPKGVKKYTERVHKEKEMDNRLHFNELEKYFLGETIFNSFPKQTTTAYPRFNLKKENNGFEIQMALPGWSKDQISITHHKSQLTIKGTKPREDTTPATWIHKGISEKNFSRSFNLDADLEIASASFIDGLLIIILGYTPASAPQVIDIA